MKIVLGSGSPRRKEILSFFSIPFTQVSPPFDESKVQFNDSPINFVEEISERKNLSLQDSSDSLIITSDTTVYCNGKIYGKPSNPAEAEAMLVELQGRWHEVYSAITISKEGKTITKHDCTKVLLNTLTLDQIRLFQKKCGALDKAGGYAIQKEGSILVDRIDGCYYNVMGLPINILRSLLELFDINLWNYLD